LKLASLRFPDRLLEEINDLVERGGLRQQDRGVARGGEAAATLADRDDPR